MERFTNVPFDRVQYKNGFWRERILLNRNVSLESVLERFEETGRMEALRFTWRKKEHPLHFYYDSDVAKWIEAVAYQIKLDPRGMKKYERVVDKLVASMEKNQREDGYLNSYFQQVKPEEIYTNRDWHELYCSGHLMEAAVAYHEATGKDRFLRVMEKNADCIERAFFTEKTAKFSTPGHQEIELALVKMYRHTGKKKYLDMARGFLLARGRRADDDKNVSTQSETDLLHMTRVTGHAVRALYYLAGAADVARETEDEELLTVCRQLFEDIATKTYVTGGFGSHYLCECFTVPYDLPNKEAYSESCAAIAMLYFIQRLQAFGPRGEYGDLAEKILYNTLLSSTSLSGDAFFYENPLEIDRAWTERNLSAREHRAIFKRVKVFDCSCCPPNINRIFSSLADLFYTEGKECLYVNQYVSTTLRHTCGRVDVTTRYPKEGTVRIRLSDYRYERIALRIPAFSADAFTVTVNGKKAEGALKDGYLTLPVSADCEILLRLSLRPVFLEANPRVHADGGRVALTLGPVIYCIEEEDNGRDLSALSVDTRRRVEKIQKEPFPLPCLVAQGERDRPFSALYRPAKGEVDKVSLTYIPYAYFANRPATDMQVWVRKK